ncbi:MAG: cytidylate kinase-like family protein [Paludibacter sp.]
MTTSKPFAITISRQLGAGGAFVGQQLANKLSIFFADRDILRDAANLLSSYEENLESREEKLLSFWQSFLKSSPQSDLITVPSVSPALEYTDQELFDTEAEIIKKIVQEQPAVILGRCGHYILRDEPNHISIFLHAEKDFRINRIQKLYNVPTDVATKMVEKSDKDRAAFCKTFTHKEWLNATNYDLSIDTAKIKLEQAVELILEYVKLHP